jgi:large subunit ribosomal protein L3
MKIILGKKLQMTQKFAADGTVTPVTAVLAGPCFITQVKADDKDGYKAVQIGFGEKNKISKPLAGHLKNLGKFAYLKEFRLKDKDELGEMKRGDKITTADFAIGQIVEIAGTSKGRGFQGVVKRHHFHGHPASHGHKDQLRTSGSIGAGGIQHVMKGMRMGGHMGVDRVTIKNLEIIDIDKEKNIIFIKGAVPGARNGLVEVRVTKEVEAKKVK